MDSQLVLELGFFDPHVLEFTGLEDLPAFQAFNKFGIFVAGDDLNARVLALIHSAFLIGGLRRRG